MPEIDGQEVVEHIINVDKHAKVTLLIPKEMEPIEFQAIAIKAKKLFSISEVPIVDRDSSLGIERKKHFWIKGRKALLYKLKEVDKRRWDDIAKEIGCDRGKCQRQVAYLKGRDTWDIKLLDSLSNTEEPREEPTEKPETRIQAKNVVRGTVSWTPKMEDELFRLKVVLGQSWKQIEGHMEKYPGVTEAKLLSKFNNMKVQKEGKRFKELKKKYRI